MCDIADTIFFKDICSMLEKIQSASGSSKEKYIRRYYESFQKHRESFRLAKGLSPSAEEDGQSSFYCVLRCLIPRSDTARPPYGLQINTLGRAYAKVLQIPPDSSDVRRLEGCTSRDGDYAETVYKVLLPRTLQTDSSLTLKQVHELLDSIATDDIRNTEKVLTKLLETASAQEQKWFIRLMLKSMHLSIGEQKIFAILHPKAKEVYQYCTNLSRLCRLLAENNFPDEPSTSNRNGGGDTVMINGLIEPFQALQPMLCERFMGSINSLMASDVLYMETKMDGERFHIHYDNGQFKYISRNGKDYTYSFGKNASTGNLTPKLSQLLPIGVPTVILDGEMMVWDTQQKRFRDKGENTDVKHLSGRSSWFPCFVAYDLLYLDGSSLLDKPYAQRIHKLTELFKELPGVFQIMKPVKITSEEQFCSLFDNAMKSNEEGVVLKKQNSLYQPGVRQGGGWYKVKPDYIEGLTTDFDLLIMGGFYNRAQTFIAAFLLGVLKYTSPDKFEIYSVGKVPNISRHRSQLNDCLKPHWRNISTEPPPMWYHYIETNPEGRPHVWIEPRNSTILQIRATDLTPSSAFYLNKSLHFPRVEQRRNDKIWTECMSIQEFYDISQSNNPIKKIHKRNVHMADFTTNQKRLKITPAQRRKLGMEAYGKKVNVEEIEKSSSLFKDLQFCIISSYSKDLYTIDKLKALVVSNGGGIVENPIKNQPCCITVAGDRTFRVNAMIATGEYDILSVDWLLKTCRRQNMQIRPKDLICCTANLQKQMLEIYDKYGDSYTEDVDIEELKDILCDDTLQTEANSCELSSNEMLKMEDLLFGCKSMNFFRNCCSFFYDNDQHSELAKFVFRWRGGIVVDVSDKARLQSVSYIFINIDKMDRSQFIAWLKACFPEIPKNLHIVNINWILHSDRAKRKLDVLEYTWHNF